MGLGALVTKTITTHEPILKRPFIYGEKNYIMNCEPWSEYTFETWKEQFLPQVAEHKNSRCLSVWDTRTKICDV